MSNQEHIVELIHRLHALFEKPEPGLFTWHELVNTTMRELAAKLKREGY